MGKKISMGTNMPGMGFYLPNRSQASGLGFCKMASASVLSPVPYIPSRLISGKLFSDSGRGRGGVNGSIYSQVMDF
uniref:Uncharacterized protein n=1 Tax=Saimiri boliviensis boliviensis TaxID=39432 RepID=A0A2K6UFC0_SAIBB